MIKNDVWRVRIDHVTVATVHIPGSDANWQLIGAHRQLIADAAGPGARVTLASDANERGALVDPAGPPSLFIPD